MTSRIWMKTIALTFLLSTACSETSTTPGPLTPTDTIGSVADVSAGSDSGFPMADTLIDPTPEDTAVPVEDTFVPEEDTSDPDTALTPDTTPSIDAGPEPDPAAFDTELCGTYEADIQAMFEKACVGCHNAQAPLGGLDLSSGTSFATLTSGASQSGVPYIVPGDIDASYFASKLTDSPLDGAKMPPPPSELTAEELEHVWAWIGNGAPNGAYGPCEPVEPEGSDITFKVTSQETAPGNLAIALFKVFPPLGPPDYVVNVPNVTFPVTTSVTNVLPGKYTAYVALDIAPFSAGNPGPEDISVNVSVVAPAPETVLVGLGGFDDTCGECALDAVCGVEPTDPTVCVAPPGTCGDVPSEGICFSEDIVIRCSDVQDPNGTLKSQDCSLTDQICGALPNSPNSFGCVAKPEPEPEPEPEWEPVAFAQVHPKFQKSCSGLFCHGLGFASNDIDSAYETVITKGLTKKILGAVQAGSMPKGAFGTTICTGDPSVDTNPKCYTQEELDLLILWVATETGEAPYVEPPPPEVPVSFAEVHPILNDKCSGGVCHGGGLGNPDIDKAYEAIIEKNLCKNIWFQIQYGKMPIGKGCTGDPVEDSKIDGCLNEEEYQLVKDWANGEIPCAE